MIDRGQVNKLLLMLAENYQNWPTTKYMASVLDFICQRATSMEQVQDKLADIPIHYDKFPTMKEFAVIFPKRRPKLHVVQDVEWKSSVPGTPASVEALFNMIDKGETETGKFRFGLRYVGLNEESLFAAYEDFKNGKISESIKHLNGKRFSL